MDAQRGDWLMADINLTQSEADILISMEKHRENETRWTFPGLSGTISIPLISANGKERFILDVTRGKISLAKCTYQNRAREIVVLIRLDIGGPKHTNPDEKEIACPHLHIYRENYGDKWAYQIPVDRFQHIVDPWETFIDFMDFCNITKQPYFERELFQ